MKRIVPTTIVLMKEHCVVILSEPLMVEDIGEESAEHRHNQFYRPRQDVPNRFDESILDTNRHFQMDKHNNHRPSMDNWQQRDS